MRKSITLGNIAGIPLKIQMNWFITAVLVTWSLSGGYFPVMYPGFPVSTYWFYGGISSILFFASVLVHEFGHAIVSLKEGVPVRSISLFIFGGMAHISREPSTPKSEFRIVAAGPLASLLLAVVFTILSTVMKSNPLASGAAAYLGQLNFILALFNLIPAFPLDGGRLLRSALWAIVRDFVTATRWAANIGILLAGLSMLAGFYVFMRGFMFNGVWILFIGFYLAYTARASYQQSVRCAPWPDINKRVSASRLESIAFHGRHHNYRAAIIRMEAVNHYPAQGLPQPIYLPIENQAQSNRKISDNP